MIRSSLVLLPLAACAGGPSPIEEGPTWYGDVQPIVATRCAGCHDGEYVDIALTDGESAAALATSIGMAVREGRMPPPAADPACRDYDGAEAVAFPDHERELLLAWTDAGAPLGDPADEKEPPPAEEALDADLLVPIGTPHPTDFAETNEYLWCYDAEVPVTGDAWIGGFEIVPGDTRLVHHVVVFEVTGPTPVPHVEGGQACDSVGGAGIQLLAAWALGTRPVRFPAGTGLPIDEDTQLIFQVHYEGSPERSGAEIETAIRFDLVDEPERELSVIDRTGDTFVVPAGDPAWSLPFEFTFEDPRPFHLVAAIGHMHQLGRELHMRHVDAATGQEECVIDASPWDFHRQLFLVFDEEVVYRQGDTYGWTCTWDNSPDSPYQYNDPPRDVPFGLGIFEEMCTAASFGWYE